MSGLTRQQNLASFMAMLAVLGFAACARQPAESDTGLRGVGTPGVSTYLGSDQTTSLQAMLARCRQVPQQISPIPGDRSLSAACDQLHRTLHSQPGNSVEPGATP